jgi:hypothetical protein
MKFISVFAALLLIVFVSFTSPSLVYAAHDGQKSAAKQSDTVIFNVKTHKYHIPSCIWAKRCTANCIAITRAEAIQRGGVPCKVCGGGEY